MSKLVIVESPAKAKTIKKYLGAGYDVTASMGHVRDLPAAKLSVDVKNDFAPKYAIIKGKEKLVKELQEKAANSEKVFLATDPDREGEAISWHLATILGLDLKEKNRVKFNEINKTSVKEGIEHPETVDVNLVNAQQARRILDRLVGYKLSPFVSQKIRRGLSAGRVQSVAVRLIVDREDEIKAFVPEEYWSLDAKFTAPSSRKAFSAAFIGDENGKVKITNKQQADTYLARLDGAEYIASSVKKGTRKKQPAPPFSTSTLQQEASKRLGLQAQRTMRIAQELYEGIDVEGIGSVGLITYMRTDSLRISEEARAEANTYIASAYGDKYLPEKPRYFKTRAGAQDGHEAIRPTMVELTPEKARGSLTPEQYKLYNLIWKRYVASLMAACVQDTVKLEIKATGESDRAQSKECYCLFGASGYSVRFDGYTALYEYSSDDEDEESGSNLPDIKENDSLKLKELGGNQHFTQPPARYSEAALIKTLEETGVGRPSTYASIVTTIVKREYVVREAKMLKPTELGTATTKLLRERFPKIVNTKFTAAMETNLDEIGNGQTDYVAVLHGFYDEFEAGLVKARAEMSGVKIQLEEDITDVICEKCGKNMVIKSGRFGKFLACPGYPDCKNTKPLVEETNALCPRCSGKVIGKKSKKGYVFYGCGNYPNCNFMTWDKPTGENCPKCGKSLFKGRGGIISCLNEGCDYQIKAPRKKKSSSEEQE
ncbi:MAG: type I DNA topoisomerase [Clostridiales bacterium]|nr:type I DNA topoisomerase [Clostridiales bacterium]